MMGLLDRLGRGRNLFMPDPLAEGEWRRSDWAKKQRLQLLEDGEVEEDEIAPGVLEVHWAAMKPLATRELPSRPGWWATRLDPYKQWSIVEVVMDAHHQLWWSLGVRERAIQVLPERGRWWSDRPYDVPR